VGFQEAAPAEVAVGVGDGKKEVQGVEDSRGRRAGGDGAQGSTCPVQRLISVSPDYSQLVKEQSRCSIIAHSQSASADLRGTECHPPRGGEHSVKPLQYRICPA